MYNVIQMQHDGRVFKTHFYDLFHIPSSDLAPLLLFGAQHTKAIARWNARCIITINSHYEHGHWKKRTKRTSHPGFWDL